MNKRKAKEAHVIKKYCSEYSSKASDLSSFSVFICFLHHHVSISLSSAVYYLNFKRVNFVMAYKKAKLWFSNVLVNSLFLDSLFCRLLLLPEKILLHNYRNSSVSS